MCVLMTPSDTALTRMPRDAYSIASERVTAASPPLVRAASAAGIVLTACSTRVVLMLTMWPLPCVSICGMTALRHVEEPGQIDRGHGGVVVEGVLREGLANVDPGIVDQGVDPPVSDPARTAQRVGPCQRQRCRLERRPGRRHQWKASIAQFPQRRTRLCGTPATKPAPIPCDAPVMTATFWDPGGGSVDTGTCCHPNVWLHPEVGPHAALKQRQFVDATLTQPIRDSALCPSTCWSCSASSE